MRSELFTKPGPEDEEDWDVGTMERVPEDDAGEDDEEAEDQLYPSERKPTPEEVAEVEEEERRGLAD
jgi:hypothetical protein